MLHTAHVPRGCGFCAIVPVMHEQTDIEKELEQELYGYKTILVTECENGFRQVMLSAEQFKQISDIIFELEEFF